MSAAGWDPSALTAGIEQWSQAAKDAAADAVEELVEVWLEEGNRRVPLEEGTLQNSGTTKMDRENLTGAVGWGAGGARAYAVRQHEDTSLHHDEGRTSKWGENAGRYIATIASDHITEKVKGAGG